MSRMSSTASARCCAKAVLALVDFDPDGLTIFLTYKYGPLRTIHDRDAQTTPNVEWIGPTSADIDLIGQKHESQVMMLLSKRDRDKASSMLGWPNLAEDGAEPFVRRELQVMLMTGFKFETQMLDLVYGGLDHWLSCRMSDVLAALG